MPVPAPASMVVPSHPASVDTCSVAISTMSSRASPDVNTQSVEAVSAAHDLMEGARESHRDTPRAIRSHGGRRRPPVAAPILDPLATNTGAQAAAAAAAEAAVSVIVAAQAHNETEVQMEGDAAGQMEALHKELIDELTQATRAPEAGPASSPGAAVASTGAGSCVDGPNPTNVSSSAHGRASGDCKHAGMQADQGGSVTREEGAAVGVQASASPGPTDAPDGDEASVRYALHALYGVVLSPSGSDAPAMPTAGTPEVGQVERSSLVFAHADEAWTSRDAANDQGG